jgi:hypothetical protein
LTNDAMGVDSARSISRPTTQELGADSGSYLGDVSKVVGGFMHRLADEPSGTALLAAVAKMGPVPVLSGDPGSLSEDEMYIVDLVGRPSFTSSGA